MTITTLDGVIAGAQPPWLFSKGPIGSSINKFFSTWGFGGLPGAGTFNSTLNGGTYSSTGGIVPGQIPHFDPGGGLSSYLSRFTVAATANNYTVLLCDRLWDNGGINITSTSAQTIASPSWPARDIYGLNHGIGVLLGVEVSAATASTAALTVGYTSEVGVAGHTVTLGNNQWAGTQTGNFAFFPVQSGDQGVQSVQSITLGASMTSGTINLVAVRVITALDAPGGASGASRSVDAIKSGFPKLYNGTVPFIIYMASAAAAATITAAYQETQG